MKRKRVARAKRHTEPAVVLALDQGTTSSRAVVFDRGGRALASAQREFPQHFPKPGWVEHDPQAIWDTQLAVARQALARARLSAADVAAIGIANQRETTMLWERRTGAPIHRAIVWQDRRTADYCARLKAKSRARDIHRATGLYPDPYFSASKIKWILDNVHGARARARKGELAFGTVDSWLLWKLSGGALHATDPGNASRTLLFNLHNREWDENLLRMFNVPRAILPDVASSSGIVGETAPGLFGRPIPIAGIAGDQQAALFGQAGLLPGAIKNTYGTGCFMLMNTGRKPKLSRHGLLSTVAWTLPGRVNYALEGSVFIGGAVVQWLRDGLGLIRKAADVEALARKAPDSGDVYFVPAFAGLGAPHWDPYARGAITGLTRGSTSAHIARAALEAIAFQVADVLDVMRREAGQDIAELRVDGGAAANNLLLQFQADLLQIPVLRPRILETTAFGAAMLAGAAVGFWPDPEAAAATWRPERVFEPAMTSDEADFRRRRWSDALARAKAWDKRRKTKTNERS